MGYGQSPKKLIITTHKEAGEATASGVDVLSTLRAAAVHVRVNKPPLRAFAY
ncbi:MAG: hypothetical protein HDT47_04570 [Ruminococcaceae bacterium]|nr:hypothetical protein [Oscillospiraceae bacterium]